MSWDWSDDDRARLERFLEARGISRGAVTTRRIGDGHSNLTFVVMDGQREVVVRRPPPPPTPPGAHDVLREARVMSALRGTDVPVPEVLATAEAGEVIDVPLFVMNHVVGAVITTETPASLVGQRRAIGESLVDTLAALHAVDWRARGLEGYGRAEGFNARHFRRMRALVEVDGKPPEGFGELDAWLAGHVPPEAGATIVHNDFRLGNVMIGASGRIAAVLDWELATIGDPLLDVAYLLASYPRAGEPLLPTSAMGAALLEPGYPSRAELAARYTAKTGTSLENLCWYTVLVLWKLAVLYEYGRRRALATHGDPYYADPQLVRSFLRAAEAHLEGRES